MTYVEMDDFTEKEQVVTAIKYWLNEAGVALRGARALEIGGSGGLLAGLIARDVEHVTCTDVVDWNGQYDGCFPKLLKEKFERNGRLFNYGAVEFVFGDAQNLVYRDNLFDFVFSLNVFEHVPSPVAALKEAIRVTRPGGVIYLSFDPVWTADSGSHFLHRIGEPWAHLVKDDGEISAAMARGGASPDEIQSYRRDMNRLPVAYYRDNFPQVVEDQGARLLHQASWSGTADPSYVSHPNLVAAAALLGASTDDLLVRGFSFVIQKGQ